MSTSWYDEFVLGASWDIRWTMRLMHGIGEFQKMHYARAMMCVLFSDYKKLTCCVCVVIILQVVPCAIHVGTCNVVQSFGLAMYTPDAIVCDCL